MLGFDCLGTTSRTALQHFSSTTLLETCAMCIGPEGVLEGFVRGGVLEGFVRGGAG